MFRKVVILLSAILATSYVNAEEYVSDRNQLGLPTPSAYNSSGLSDDLIDELDNSSDYFFNLRNRLLTKVVESYGSVEEAMVSMATNAKISGGIDITFSFKPVSLESEKKKFIYTYEAFNGRMEKLVILAIPQNKAEEYKYLLNLRIP